MLILVACDDGGTRAPDAGACGDGMQAIGSACVPIFDDCASDEVPLRGGGCKRVGVRECDGGIAGPPDWTCKRIGVEECDGGLRGPPDWTCKAIGPPTTCLAGWEKVKGGWCEPVLPEGTCPEGTMEVLGKKACQPVGDCGSGTWGKIPLMPYTVFVDASYPGGDSDGSKAKPYTTIGAALKSGTRIAVAAGTYKEDLELTQAWTELVGRCPQKVKVVGQSSSSPAVSVPTGPATVRGLTVTGPGWGIQVKATKVTLERVVVGGCGDHGVVITGGSSVTLKDSVITENVQAGVVVANGSQATLEGCVIRGTKPDAAGAVGAGVAVQSGSGVSLDRCLVTDNAWSGLQALGSELTVSKSLVRRTTAPARLMGNAVLAVYDGGKPAKLTLRDSLLAENVIGVGLYSSVGHVEGTVIRDSTAATSKLQGGIGIFASGWKPSDPPAVLNLKRSLVTGTASNATSLGAVMVNGSRATIERTVIHNTTNAASTAEHAGMGITVGMAQGYKQIPQLTLKDSLLADNSTTGLLLHSGDATIERTVVRGTRPLPMKASVGGGQLGDGIHATISPVHKRLPVLSISDCLVERNGADGIVLWAGNGTVSRTVIRDNLLRPGDRKHEGYGVSASADLYELKPSRLVLQESLVANNHQAGIMVSSSDAVVVRSVIRDSRPIAATKTHGLGVFLGPMSIKRASAVTLRDCLLSGHRHNAITAAGGRLTVERSVLRDTVPAGSVGGDGIQAHYYDPNWPCTVKVTESVLTGNRGNGVMAWGATVSIEGSAIRAAPGAKPGIGIAVTRFKTAAGVDVPSKLTAVDTVVSGSAYTGVAVDRGFAGSLKTCEVRDTGGYRGKYGDGVTVADRGSTLAVDQCLVTDSKRAGLLVLAAGGSVRRSVFRGGVFPVYLDQGAPFSVADDNVYVHNTENRPTSGKVMAPSPLPDRPPSFFK